MKFEIGKTYTFRNVSTEESVSFKKGDDGVYEDRVWTGGTWTFTLDDENVLDALMYAQSEDDPSTFEFDDDGPYISNTYTWSLDDCKSVWNAVLAEDSNYDKEELEYELNFVSGEHYLNDEGWEYLDGSFGSTIIVFENDSADE
tara:strand:- start:97 stop:528 length:432 start_codon:yes stop_codon:yes gene_type:complete